MTVTDTSLPVGVADEDWSGDAEYREYTRAANPVGRETPLVPVETFSADLHRDAPTGVVPLDLAAALGIDGYPATSPALLASFATVRAGEELVTEPRATSELYVVMAGTGTTEVDGRSLAWQRGDVFVLPGGCRSVHRASVDATFYWVTDEPLLRYLGVAPTERRVRPTLFPAARNAAALAEVAADPAAARRNRVSVLLGNTATPQTLTATHVLWAMVGLLPVDAVQKPHRHQSVALDLILDCAPGCYTLVGPRLTPTGEIADAQQVDWEPGGAFVTPPGWWHAHHNESGVEAHLLPVQDAGLHTHLRTLDIRFG